TLFLMQEHGAKRTSKLNGGSKMGVLPGASSVTCINGVCGGGEQQHTGYTRTCFYGFWTHAWDERVAAYAARLLHRHAVNSVKSETLGDDYLASSALQVAI
ncbi:hypothetical protein, partial [Legionella longbeachae]